MRHLTASQAAAGRAAPAAAPDCHDGGAGAAHLSPGTLRDRPAAQHLPAACCPALVEPAVAAEPLACPAAASGHLREAGRACPLSLASCRAPVAALNPAEAAPVWELHPAGRPAAAAQPGPAPARHAERAGVPGHQSSGQNPRGLGDGAVEAAAAGWDRHAGQKFGARCGGRSSVPGSEASAWGLSGLHAQGAWPAVRAVGVQDPSAWLPAPAAHLYGAPGDPAAAAALLEPGSDPARLLPGPSCQLAACCLELWQQGRVAAWAGWRAVWEPRAGQIAACRVPGRAAWERGDGSGGCHGALCWPRGASCRCRWSHAGIPVCRHDQYMLAGT